MVGITSTYTVSTYSGDTHSVTMDALASFAAESPLLTAMLGLALAWVLAKHFVSGRGLSVGAPDTALSSHDDAVRAARQRQQAKLDEIAAQRAAAAPSVVKGPSSTPPAPAQSEDAAMPSRMAAAAARAEAAAARAAADPMPTRMATAMARTEAAASAKQSGASDTPPHAASASASELKRADDPNSVSARLARIQKGKGPSEHNPLHGHSSGSSAGSSFQCSKKGG